MKQPEFDIDIIVTWVDGSDPAWIAEFNQYAPEQNKKTFAPLTQFRDYGTMRYWFRAVEKYAPWIHRVFFVTNGQKPDWLNLNCPRLRWIKHADYIPAKWLPVFSSRPIELYVHKIPELSEHFVLFCDDMLFTKPTNPDYFFKKGLPCDQASLAVLTPFNNFSNNIFNELRIINNHFKKKDVIKQNFWKWFNPKYGTDNLKTFFLSVMGTGFFSNFVNYHQPNAYLKSAWEHIWEENTEILEATMSHRFRSLDDVQQWFFKYWILCEGKFSPRKGNKGIQYWPIAEKNIKHICRAIEKQKGNILITQDAPESHEEVQQKMIDSLQKMLPEKSSFER